jgi:hypothetical protein
VVFLIQGEPNRPQENDMAVSELDIKNQALVGDVVKSDISDIADKV